MFGGLDHCTIRPAWVADAFLSISPVVLIRRFSIPTLSSPVYCHLPAVTNCEPSLNRSRCSEVPSARSSSVELSIPRPEQLLPFPQWSRYCPTKAARGSLGLREQPSRHAMEETTTAMMRHEDFILALV